VTPSNIAAPPKGDKTTTAPSAPPAAAPVHDAPDQTAPAAPLTGRDAIPAQVRLEDKPCPLGCADGDEFVMSGRDRLNDLPGRYRVVRCKGCGLMRTNPRPTPDTIGYYYPSDYGPYVSTRVEGGPKWTPPVPLAAGETFERPLTKRIGRGLFATNTHRLPLDAPGRMLEMGCASGAIMKRMAMQGWEVEGIEYSDEAAQSARDLGFKVHTGAVEGAPDPAVPYDLITGWMVVEHLHEPLAVLEKLHRWTRPGGYIAISIPNAACAGLRWYKEAWYPLCLPIHLYHYTPATLEKLFARAGWTLDRVFPQRVLGNTIASTGYLLNDKKMAPGLAQKLIKFTTRPTRAHMALYPLAFTTSLFAHMGCITVWAKKDEE